MRGAFYLADVSDNFLYVFFRFGGGVRPCGGGGRFFSENRGKGEAYPRRRGGGAGAARMSAGRRGGS